MNKQATVADLKQLVLQYLTPDISLYRTSDMLAPINGQARMQDFNEININFLRMALWDLTLDRVLRPSPDNPTTQFWLTEHGRELITKANYPVYDPEGYIKALRTEIPDLDPIIGQYITEALSCIHRGLNFAAAVMLGAAAEKAVLLLLESIMRAKISPNDQGKISKLLAAHGSLPKIYEEIINTLKPLTAKNGRIDYSIHEGCDIHLAALLDMIREQRNDAVHPICGNVSESKLILSFHGFPHALQILYKLKHWFDANPDSI